MKRERGFSIIAVVFLLVVLTGLGVVIVQLATTQHLGLLMAQEGRQAWYAARAGAEWGRHRILHADSCTAATLEVEGYTVTIACTALPEVVEGSERLRVYHVDSTATRSDAAIGTVTRVLRMAVWKGSTP